MKLISSLTSETLKWMGGVVRGIVPWWKPKVNASFMVLFEKLGLTYPYLWHILQTKDLIDIICHGLQTGYACGVDTEFETKSTFDVFFW